MSSFHTICTTCKARLKVRDPAVIGKILTCPQCGSMVLVSVSEEEAAAAAAAAGRKLADTIDDSEGSRESPISRSMQDTVDGPFDASPPEGIDAEGIAGEEWDESAEPVEESAVAERPLLPDADWMLRESRQLRQWLLTGAAMVGGVLMAVALVGFLIGRQRNDAPNVARSDPATSESRPDAGAEPTSADLETDPKSGTADSAADPQADAAAPDAAPPASDAAPGGTNAVGDADGSPDNVTSDNVTPDNATPDNAGPDAAPGAADVDASSDPASGPGDKPVVPAPPGLEPADEGPLDMDLSSDLSDLEGMLDDGGGGVPLLPTSPADPDRDSQYDRVLADVSPARRPKPLSVDAASQLAETIPAVQVSSVPLQQFVRFVTDLTTVPVTLDADALRHAGVSPETPVTVQLEKAAVGQILAAAVQPLGLQVSVREQHVRIVLAGEGLLDASLPAGDLAADEQQRQALQQLVMDVVQPDSWDPAGPGRIAWDADQEALRIRNRREVLHETLTLLEKLRVARELPTRSGLPAERFRLQSRRSRAVPKLARLISVNFRDPAPLTQVLDKLGELSGMQLLVDWEAVAVEGWNPLAEATLLTDDETLAKSLRLLLTPMSLDYYVSSEDVLVITTPAALAAQVDLELYPAPDLIGPDVELALAQVRDTLGEDRFQPAGRGVLRVDEPSRCLIAALPQDSQRALLRLLDQHRRRP